MRTISNTNKHIIALLRIGLGFVFIYSSLPKIIDPIGFSIVVANYQILPENMAYPVAVYLPFLELSVGISIITGIWLRGSFGIALCSLFIFLIALVFNLVRGINIDCGCFSTDLQEVSKWTMWWHILRDLILIAWTIFMVFTLKDKLIK